MELCKRPAGCRRPRGGPPGLLQTPWRPISSQHAASAPGGPGAGEPRAPRGRAALCPSFHSGVGSQAAGSRYRPRMFGVTEEHFPFMSPCAADDLHG